MQVVKHITSHYSFTAHLSFHSHLMLKSYLALQKLWNVDHDGEQEDGNDVSHQHSGVTPVNINTRLRSERWLYAHSHPVAKLTRAMIEIAFYCQKCLFMCISQLAL